MKPHSRISLLLVLAIVLVGLVSLDARAQQANQDHSAHSAKPLAGVAEADLAAIRQTALDYVEGWYEGNAERMERALHPDLAKRIVRTDPQSKRSRLDQMSAMGLVQGARAGWGKNTPKEKQIKEVHVLDVFENVASVKAVMSDWIDYMHIAKFSGRWVIVNVLWEMKPAKN